jgi:multisubunit Na+/H+ antiporter MnhE subunit
MGDREIVPLTSGFVVTSIVGLTISLIYVYPRSGTWGFTFTLFFILMFVASMISMAKAPIDDHLKVHELGKRSSYSRSKRRK